MTREKCRCGHDRKTHVTFGFCDTGKCMNVCWEYVPVVLPDQGERLVFGKHRLDAETAWTPEPLSEYWDQEERWKP